MHTYVFAYIKFNWYLKHVYFVFENVIGTFYWYLEPFIVYAYLCMFQVSYSLHIYVYLFMHELRGSFFEA